jgi:hypothetical protein
VEVNRSRKEIGSAKSALQPEMTRSKLPEVDRERRVLNGRFWTLTLTLLSKVASMLDCSSSAVFLPESVSSARILKLNLLVP